MPPRNSETYSHLELRRMYTGRTIGALVWLSILTVVFIGFSAATLAWAFEIKRWVVVGFAVGNFAGASVWIMGLKWLRREWAQIGQPYEVREAARFELVKSPNSRQFHTFRNANNSEVMQLATLLAKGNVINSSTLARIFGGRQQADAFRDELIEAGYLRWRNLDNPKDGVTLTQKGSSFFGEIATTTSPLERALIEDGFQRLHTQGTQHE